MKKVKPEFDRQTYNTFISPDIKKYILVNPRFVPMPKGKDILLCLDGQVFSPYNTIREVDFPPSVEALSKERSYVLYTNDGVILGTNLEVIAKNYSQPREAEYGWLIADKVEEDLHWFRQYGTSTGLSSKILDVFINNKEIVSSPLEVTRDGCELYFRLLDSALELRGIDSESVMSRMMESFGSRSIPLYSYKTKRFLKEAVK